MKPTYKSLQSDFLDFIVNHPPATFSASLRRMLLDYLINQQKLGLPLDFNDFLQALYDLFELLDKASTLSLQDD